LPAAWLHPHLHPHSATEAPVFDPNVTGPITAMQPASRTTSAMPTETPIPAQAPGTSRPSDATDENTVTALKGMSKALAANMDASLTVPTATSVRTIPAKLMIDNRIVVNNTSVELAAERCHSRTSSVGP
jgi:multifunctional 2-oxoglutarate metabolism enzyme